MAFSNYEDILSGLREVRIEYQELVKKHEKQRHQFQKEREEQRERNLPKILKLRQQKMQTSPHRSRNKEVGVALTKKYPGMDQ